jgi:hypothetical protein
MAFQFFVHVLYRQYLSIIHRHVCSLDYVALEGIARVSSDQDRRGPRDQFAKISWTNVRLLVGLLILVQRRRIRWAAVFGGHRLVCHAD